MGYIPFGFQELMESPVSTSLTRFGDFFGACIVPCLNACSGPGMIHSGTQNGWNRTRTRPFFNKLLFSVRSRVRSSTSVI